VVREFGFDPRTVAALKRLTLGTGCSYLKERDFSSFLQNVAYFGARLAKLEVDTRLVARSLEIYQSLCDPHLLELFGDRQAEASAALESLNSAAFVALSGSYFDAKSGESSALLSVMEAEHTSPNVSVLFQRVLEIVLTTFGANNGALMLKVPDADVLALEASVGIDAEEYGLTIPYGQGFSGAIAQSGEAQAILDTSLDERIVSPTLKQKAKTLWGVPLKLDGRSVGALVIGFDKPYYEWLPRECHLMQAMGDRAAGAIERARMLEALKEREMLIAQLSGHLLSGQEEERKRISRELHDETGQALMVIRLYLSMLEKAVKTRGAKSKINETVEVVDRTIEGLRRIIAKLSPLVLEELGLVAAIRKEAKDLSKNTGIVVRVQIPDNLGRFAPQVETALYRIVQEALHNVAKHSQASTVEVDLGVDSGQLKLLVADDGVGIVERKGANRGQSFGLAGIKERVSTMSGVVRVHSAKGQGTRIEISVPAAQAADAPKPVLSAGGGPQGPQLVLSAAAQGGSNA
jgi:signal transduction histidine kinase